MRYDKDKNGAVARAEYLAGRQKGFAKPDVDNDGKILGLRGAMLHDTGAYLPWGIIVPFIARLVPGYGLWLS